MNEYVSLGHMSKISAPLEETISNYYMPHHGVLKPHSTTTKLRVVFNVSSKTSSELSLNDILLKGPCIQEQLFSIIIQSRKHSIIIMPDI